MPTPHARVGVHTRLEGDEVRDREWRAAVGAAARAARLVGHRVGHQVRPRVAGEALEEEQRGGAERLEVAHVVDSLLAREEGEELHAEDGVDEDAQPEERADVDERGEGEDERHDQVAQLARALEQPQDAHDAQDAQHAQQEGRHRQDPREQRGRELVEQRDAHEEEVEAAPAEMQPRCG